MLSSQSKMLMSKNVWRAKMLDARSELGPDKVAELSRALCKNLLFIFAEGGGLGNPKSKPLWGGYKSFKWEADPTQGIIESSPYLRWAYPKVTGETEMDFFEPFKTDANWLKNKWGIWEPDVRTAEKVNLNEFAGILIPGVAFDRDGRRLGYGKGFYDRALANYKGLKVGVSFSLQIADSNLPHEDNDVLMNLVVTDAEIIKCSRH